MKIDYYFGIDSAAIEITQPTDIYTLLDWACGEMMGKSDTAKGTMNVKKWENATEFIGELMELVEARGFGNTTVCDI